MTPYQIKAITGQLVYFHTSQTFTDKNLVLQNDELNKYFEDILFKFQYRYRYSNTHYVKGVHIRSFSGPYFPAFSPNAGNTDQKKSE